MVKKVFWILVFLLSTLFAYIAADLLCVYLKTIMDVPPITFSALPREEKGFKQKQNREEYYQIITKRDLFQIKPLKEDGSKDKKEEMEEERIAPITDLKLQLLGTMIGKGIVPFAIILDQKTRKQDLYMEGEEVGPAKIIKIYRNKVILEHEGNEEMLLAFDQMEGALDSTPAALEEPLPDQRAIPSADLPTKLGKKIGPNHWILEKEDVQNVITNSSQLLTQVRIIPHFAQGNLNQPDGFQVANIKPRSLFDMMGLRNGDIIKSVNRQAVDSPEKAFEAYQRFKNESQIEVVVLRNNNDVTLRYDINQ